MTEKLNIHSEYFILKNNPEVAKTFGNPVYQEFLKRLLQDLDEHSFRDLIKKGYQGYFDDIISQLHLSFEVIANNEENDGYFSIKRCIDGEIFTVGEEVFDKRSKELLPIGRLTEDDRGLHVRLDLGGGTITWRYLSDISKVEKH